MLNLNAFGTPPKHFGRTSSRTYLVYVCRCANVIDHCGNMWRHAATTAVVEPLRQVPILVRLDTFRSKTPSPAKEVMTNSITNKKGCFCASRTVAYFDTIKCKRPDERINLKRRIQFPASPDSASFTQVPGSFHCLIASKTHVLSR